jgi:hypothetical protein
MAERARQGKIYFFQALTGNTAVVMEKVVTLLEELKMAEKRSKILGWLRTGCLDTATNFTIAKNTRERSTRE